MNIAICIVAYNRLGSLRRCLSFLEKADYPEPVKLYLSVDKSDTPAVDNFAKAYHWEHGEYEPITHDYNLGLRTHILSCGDLLKKHDALIVIEDDVAVAQSFYYFAKACVEKYRDNMDIAGISLYSFARNYHNGRPFHPMPSDSDIYLMQNAMSWGQVWMKKQWKDFKDWYEKHKDDDFFANPTLPRRICRWRRSWLKYHTAYCIMEGKYFIHPYSGYSTCFSDTGEHTLNTTSNTQSYLLYGPKYEFKLTPSIFYDSYFENEAIYKALALDKKILCIDFWGAKDNRQNKRYWLSTQELPFEVVRSFGLLMKPYEANVLNGIEGNDLYLYDTSISSPKPHCRRSDLFAYCYCTKEDRIEVWKRKIKALIRRKK